VTQDPVQPLCNQVQISDSQILEQEAKVTKAQQALARAMALFEQQQSSVPIEHLSNGNSIELMS
jgi:hypothetical protein